MDGLGFVAASNTRGDLKCYLSQQRGEEKGGGLHGVTRFKLSYLRYAYLVITFVNFYGF